MQVDKWEITVEDDIEGRDRKVYVRVWEGNDLIEDFYIPKPLIDLVKEALKKAGYT